MNFIKQAIALYVKAIEVVLIVIGVILALLTFSNVIVREFSLPALPWTEEVCRYLFIWASFLGMIVVTYRGKNIGVDFFYQLCGEKLQIVMTICSKLLILSFLAIMFSGGTSMLKFAARDVSPALSVPLHYIYVAVPLAAISMLLILLFDSIEQLTGAFKKRSV